MKRLNAFLYSLFSTFMLAALFSVAGAQQQSSTQISLSNRTILLFTAPPPGKHSQLISGDVLRVRVFGHPELSSEATIDWRGMINLPFIDEVEAAGQTVEKLRSEILLRYQKFERNPQISVRLLEFTQRESVAVYAVYDNRGRETGVYTSMMRAGDLKFNWQARSLSRDNFILSFFSRDVFSDGKETYEVKALLDGGESLGLGRAIKIHPTIVTAHNDPDLEIRLKVPLTALARIAKAGEVTVQLGEIGFKLRENDLAALRFIVSHLSSAAP
ncbi:MAG: polysaccharide biosynthesis/export protein [Acidobacteriota bacterium]|nr:polysaccharide biosynthesis/export protein [Acidobacteriota bacterium]